jgi:hypothetical protein
VDAPALRSYIGGMCRLICRRVVALAVAYALALNPVLPLVAAFGSPAEAAILADLCTTNGSGSPASKQAAADLPARMFGAGLRRRRFIRRRFGQRNGVHCPHHAAVVGHRPRRPSAALPPPRCAMRPRASARLTRSFDLHW